MLPIERKIVPHVIERQDLATVGGGATARDAAMLMAARRIGAVLVVEDGRLAGIFTERDLLTRVVVAGRDPDETKVAAVMTRHPDTLRPDDSALTALELMNRRGFRHLPVVDGDELVGIVSIRDLYRNVKEQMEADIILLAETLIQG